MRTGYCGLVDARPSQRRFIFLGLNHSPQRAVDPAQLSEGDVGLVVENVQRPVVAVQVFPFRNTVMTAVMTMSDTNARLSDEV